jgi:haloacid dehalogenase superfamily, subfamily IA, variant 3 with third motif having DD or ED/haloacid dehalogenase superfamily, subfamily IA, variant 1 with third motif having Dx(3-4)D or Dx(3-4)E
MKCAAPAFIFDLDGTLIDSIEDLADAGNAALETCGFPPHPVAPYNYFVGDGMENLMRRAAPAGTDDAVIKKLVAAVHAAYATGWAIKTRPYDGIVPMLERLAASGRKLAVLSNKPHPFTVEVTRHFFPNVPFAAVQGSPAGGKAKPEPGMALAMAQELGVAPRDIVFMGDTRTDMQTAVNAGFIPLGVLWGFRPRAELEEYGAEIIIEKPEDLFRHLA